MKILIINTVPYGLNGISNVISTSITEIKKINSDVQVDVVVQGYIDKFYEDIFEKNEINIIRSPRRKNVIKYYLFLKKIGKLNKYDIVHIHGNSSTMILDCLPFRKLKNKIVVHGHNTKCTHMKIHKVLKKTFNNMYDLAIGCSKEAGEFAFTKEFVVLNNGIDIEKFKLNVTKRECLRNEYNLQNNVVCLHVGLFNNQKNQSFLVECFKNLKDDSKYKLVLIGVGELLEEAKEKAKGCSNILFLEEKKNVNDFYSMADVFLFPSVYESFGLVLLEAQINGLPCICSNLISKSSLVKKELVEYISLTEKLWCETIMGKKIRTCESQNLDDFKKFTKEEMGKTLYEIYLKLSE